MSNPVVTVREANFSQTVHDRLPPDAQILIDSEQQAKYASMKEHTYVTGILSKLDVKMYPTLLITPEVMRLTCNNDWLQKGVGKAATLSNKPPDIRRRSAPGYRAARDCYVDLPDQAATPKFPVTLRSCREYAIDKVFCAGGNFLTLGRFAKYYPRPGNLATLVPTIEDARNSLAMCGLNIPSTVPSSELKPYKLVARNEDDRHVVHLSMHSDMGFLIGSKRSNDQARDRVNGLALGLQHQFNAKLAEIRQNGDRGSKDKFMLYLKEHMYQHPWIWAFKGKTKADMYSEEKIHGAMMRFYVAAPAHLLMICQTAQQVLATHKKDISSGKSTSSVGITLAKGGAERFVAVMQDMLDRHGWAYSNYGDDTWVVIKIVLKTAGGGVRVILVRFALDMSSFDMTIQEETKRPFVSVYADEMRKIDMVSGCVWETMMMERITAVCGSHMAVMKHGNPSGMNGVTEINTMVEQDFVVRVKKALMSTRNSSGGLRILDNASVIDMDEVEDIVMDVGKRMGFTVKLEQPGFFLDTLSIKETLAASPFLYLGYFFHVVVGEDGHKDVCVMADLARTLSQVRYPKVSHIKNDEDFAVHEAMRLGSIALGLGKPTAECAKSVDSFRKEAKRCVENVLKSYGQRAASKEFLFLEQSPWGLDAEPSLTGILRALSDDPSALYMPRRNDEGELLPPPGYTEVLLENGSTVWEKTSRMTPVSAAQVSFLAQLGGDFKLGVQPSGGPVTVRSWGLPRFEKPKKAPKARTFQARAMIDDDPDDDLWEDSVYDDYEDQYQDDDDESAWSLSEESLYEEEEKTSWEISQEEAEYELNDEHVETGVHVLSLH